ncbi:cyclic-phosphate processing receiver domain-containing protein [Paenibacillus alba]|uniref:cyclic-phosphate processing receiver domain-containing protein n=1 Tax=Paenibacillus alba TaxID=1197127 RepID=UPI001FE91314|nr:cyclic-phosphate processing receiver domain-containing protein [Paenibacillus alba]
MIHVYLDDLRPCPSGFTLAKDVNECVLLLEEFEVDILSLDHDLGWTSAQTGMDVVLWLLQKRKFPKTIYIHTSSRAACIAMYQMLYTAKPEGTSVYPNRIPDELLIQVAQGTYPKEAQ